jgi:hypothetical protein
MLTEVIEMIIPDTELMAEKLGMIVLCENCGKRLKRTSIVRIRTWTHEETNNYWCEKRWEIGRMITRQASPRLGPFANQYESEPQ